MGVIAEVHLVHDDLPLVPTIERCSGVPIRYEYETTVDERRLQFVSAFSDEHAPLEEAMAADPTVSNPTRVAAFDNRAIYRVAVDTDLEIVPDRCAAAGLFVFTIASDEGGWVTRVSLPDRDALSAFRAHCRDRGISFRVNQLYDSSVSDDRTYFLTDRQYEILMMAYYDDYFEVPRGVTQDDLAERLGVSDSAVSQRLRRAISTLIGATIENGRPPEAFENDCG
ncbi:Bacterio-opsin activator HTH domain protein [Natrinema pellirubrum DSM 15624]|uniref:Bacterio-opsin activator HTH domain protein n=2 Tax=Natrinema TaxID=88723 RepID=L0JQG2_NATP1|nr:MULTISPECIES: helix-turn-helix domain-containing protein [Natrinema]ELZ10595.1 Bacterio-opsin activator HTH domain protein [Natrinema thermotolerans DSM 11552]AGB32837.1 putative DNA binding protein [Natrinema pellirubrum DSM 15624]ELY75598.1 Bacterio-opsin activator HTH domain protein [Natrinema pellirubrum DSM 15624]QCC58094.1 winged helix-turn-helix transcriptional regulator [Natrinema thermotolerans]WMT09194.1 helix-turn-helix domain-containing protein [Natrinema thermotolerans]